MDTSKMALPPLSPFPLITIKQEPPDDPPTSPPATRASDVSSPRTSKSGVSERPSSAELQRSSGLYESDKNHNSARCDKELSPRSESAGPSRSGSQEEGVTSEGKEEGYECDVCLARFRSARAFRSHGVVHKLGAEGLGRGSAGGEDLYGSVFKAGLGGRGGVAEGELPPFRCHECQTTFTTRDTYAMHMLLRAKNETCCSRPLEGKQEPASPPREHASSRDTAVKLGDQQAVTSGQVTSRLLGYSSWPKLGGGGRPALSSPRAWLRDWLPVSSDKEVLVCHICREIFTNKDSLAMHVFCHTRSEIEASNENETAASRWPGLESSHMRSLAEKLALRVVAMGGKMPTHLPYLSPIGGGVEGGARPGEAHTRPGGSTGPRENGAVFPSNYRSPPLPQGKQAAEDPSSARGQRSGTASSSGSPSEFTRPLAQGRLDREMEISPEWPSILDDDASTSHSLAEQQASETGLDLSKTSQKSGSSGDEQASPEGGARVELRENAANAEFKSAIALNDIDPTQASGDLEGGRGRMGRRARGSPWKAMRTQPYPSPSACRDRLLQVTPSPEPDLARDGSALSSDAHLASARAALERSGGHVGMCRHCDIIFLDRTLFQLHMGLHNVNNPWQCNACGKVLASRLQFSSHVLHY